MNRSNGDELRRLTDELIMLLRETEEYHAQAEVKQVLEAAWKRLLGTRRRLDLAARRYVIGVVGLSNVGKSTLLNALLGAHLAPRGNGPCTAVPIEFVHGASLCVTEVRRTEASRVSWRCRDPEELSQRIASLAEEQDPAASRAIRKVIVQAPLPLLEEGLVIADTPGFGAAQVSGVGAEHEASLLDYLRREISQVFWVVLVQQGIGKREMSFHDRLFADLCHDVLVTGCEEWDDQDRKRFERRFEPHFRERRPRFHFVSGLQGARARQEQDEAALEQSGILLLESHLRDLARPERRFAMLRDEVLQVAEDVALWLAEFRDPQGRRLASCWRPDSWSRWRRALTDAAEPRFAQAMAAKLRARR